MEMDTQTKLHLTVEQSDGTLIEKVIDIHSNDFMIDEGDLEGELCRAGALLCYYGDLAAELDAKASNAKNGLEEVEAVVSITLRASGKYTQGMVDNALAINPDVKIKRDALVEAQKEALKASNLFRAMNQRVECLKALSYRTNKQERNF